MLLCPFWVLLRHFLVLFRHLIRLYYLLECFFGQQLFFLSILGCFLGPFECFLDLLGYFISLFQPSRVTYLPFLSLHRYLLGLLGHAWMFFGLLECFYAFLALISAPKTFEYLLGLLKCYSGLFRMFLRPSQVFFSPSQVLHWSSWVVIGPFWVLL